MRSIVRRLAARLSVITFVVALLVSRSVVAEHRVALLIDNSKYRDEALRMPQANLDGLVRALEAGNVRCQRFTNLDEKKLISTIRGFAESTPTRGTAVVFFRGHVRPGAYKGKASDCLLGTDSRPGRGFGIADVFRELDGKGGSSTNIVAVDVPVVAPGVKWHGVEPPKGALVAFVDHARLARSLAGATSFLDAFRESAKRSRSAIEKSLTLEKAGSRAIASPENFVIGKRAGDEWVDSRGTVFCWCPPGTYMRGSPPSERGRDEDEEQEEVRIEHGFWIAKYEMTLRENPRGRSGRTIAKRKNDPLTMVNLDDANRMTKRTLTERERKAGRLPAGWRYALTSAEQWEYAARAGTTTAWFFGDDETKLPLYANFADRTYWETEEIAALHAHRTLDDGVAKLALVGSYAPNPWGLHDVYGNVAEWCRTGALRGGGWASLIDSCRSAHRNYFSSRREQNFIGYRVVIERVPPEAESKGKKKAKR